MLDKFLNLKLNYKLIALLVILISISFLHFGVSYISDVNDLFKEDIYFSWEEG